MKTVLHSFLFLEKKSPMTDQQMNDPRNHFEKSMKHTYFPVPMENTWIRFFLTDTVHTLRSSIIFDKRTNLVQNSLPWAKKRETVCFFNRTHSSKKIGQTLGEEEFERTERERVPERGATDDCAASTLTWTVTFGAAIVA